MALGEQHRLALLVADTDQSDALGSFLCFYFYFSLICVLSLLYGLCIDNTILRVHPSSKTRTLHHTTLSIHYFRGYSTYLSKRSPCRTVAHFNAHLFVPTSDHRVLAQVCLERYINTEFIIIVNFRSISSGARGNVDANRYNAHSLRISGLSLAVPEVLRCCRVAAGRLIAK